MTIDISKIRLGDTVTLGPFEVTRRDATSGYVSVRIGGGDCAFDADLIASHTPREFQIGDRVKWTTYDGARGWQTSHGTIAGVHGINAWVIWEDKITRSPIWPTAALKLADPDQ